MCSGGGIGPRFLLSTSFSNYLLAAAAGLVMVGRLPDLIWEAQTGQRVGRSNAPKGAMYVLGLVLMLAAMPVVWFALCQ